MIYGDSAEKKYVHDAFQARYKEKYTIKNISVFDCELQKILLQHGEKTYCAFPEEIPILLENGFQHTRDKQRCNECGNIKQIKLADFEIADGRAYYERKTAADFVSSRKERLYNQLNVMDTFIEDGHKGLILEIGEDD